MITQEQNLTSDKVKTSHNELLIIILTYNEFKLTINTVKNCLELKNCSYKILIIDNNSPNEAIYENLIREFGTHPKIKVVKRIVNDGYAGGNNYGIKIAKNANFKYCWILNNDVSFDNNTFIAENIKLFERNKGIALIGHRILNADHTGEKKEPKNTSLIYETLNNTCFFKRAPRILDYRYQKKSRISGASMLLNMEHIETLGFLIEDFFMYGEEDEYCLRAWRKKFHVYIDNNAFVDHYGGIESNSLNNNWKLELMIRNKIALIKFYNFGKQCVALTIFFISILWSAIKDMRYRRLRRAKIRMETYFKYIFILTVSRNFDLIKDNDRILKKIRN